MQGPFWHSWPTALQSVQFAPQLVSLVLATQVPVLVGHDVAGLQMQPAVASQISPPAVSQTSPQSAVARRAERHAGISAGRGGWRRGRTSQAQVAALKLDLPPMQVARQAPLVQVWKPVPQMQVPPEQILPLLFAVQSMQIPPPVPQAVLVLVWQTPFRQQPLPQVVALQLLAMDTHSFFFFAPVRHSWVALQQVLPHALSAGQQNLPVEPESVRQTRPRPWQHFCAAQLSPALLHVPPPPPPPPPPPLAAVLTVWSEDTVSSPAPPPAGLSFAGRSSAACSRAGRSSADFSRAGFSSVVLSLAGRSAGFSRVDCCRPTCSWQIAPRRASPWRVSRGLAVLVRSLLGGLLLSRSLRSRLLPGGLPSAGVSRVAFSSAGLSEWIASSRLVLRRSPQPASPGAGVAGPAPFSLTERSSAVLSLADSSQRTCPWWVSRRRPGPGAGFLLSGLLPGPVAPPSISPGLDAPQRAASEWAERPVLG